MENNRIHDCGGAPHAGFRHILPLFAIPLAIGLMRGIARRRYSLMGEHRQAEWKNNVPPMFAEMHRRAHTADEADKPVEQAV